MFLFFVPTDANIPTIRTNIPNTETGHCTKSLKILKMVAHEITRNKSLADIEWIVLADDDTILSPSALANQLSCFKDEEDVYLGERYGYQLHTEDGYNYVTGGGGVVLNRNVLVKLITGCECPSLTSPDDMIIAACLHNMDISPIHSSLFHQARPNDYPPQTLEARSISFHKHWQIDPYHVYNKWFRRNDQNYFYGSRKHINQGTHISLDSHFCEESPNLQPLKESEMLKHSDL
jgi:UDP-glucose:O-linked fucose beta-1,3-glucosyltransferase